MTRIQTAQFNILHTAFFAIAGLLLTSILFYAFFINATISNIVERKSVDRKIAETGVNIGELESVYMKLCTGITPVLAESLGFKETKNVTFAMRGSNLGLAKLGE